MLCSPYNTPLDRQSERCCGSIFLFLGCFALQCFGPVSTCTQNVRPVQHAGLCCAILRCYLVLNNFTVLFEQLPARLLSCSCNWSSISDSLVALFTPCRTHVDSLYNPEWHEACVEDAVMLQDLFLHWCPHKRFLVKIESWSGICAFSTKLFGSSVLPSTVLFQYVPSMLVPQNTSMVTTGTRGRPRHLCWLTFHVVNVSMADI